MDVPVGSGREVRAVLPLVDFANHDERASATVSWDDAAGGISLHTNTSFEKGEEVVFSYGEKPSRFWLLMYGFVPERNSADCVEFAMEINMHDPLYKEKSKLMRKHKLHFKARNYELHADRLDPDLLRATRLLVMDAAELYSKQAVRAALDGSSVSARNEAHVRALLLNACDTLLLRYPTTLDEDEALLGAALNASSAALSEPGQYATGEQRDRERRAALELRMREKRVLHGAARAVLRELPAYGAEEACELRFHADVERCMERSRGDMFRI